MKANEKVWTIATAIAFFGGCALLGTCSGEAEATIRPDRTPIPRIVEPEQDSLGNVLLPGKPEFLLVYVPGEGAHVLDVNSARSGEAAERIAAETGPRCIESLKASLGRTWDGRVVTIVCMPNEVAIGEPVAPPPQFVAPPPPPEE